MAHVKGLHELGGVRMPRVTGRRDDAGKLTATLARLDHQRALLARQLEVWTEKQKVTKERLDLLDKQIAQLRRSIRGLVAAPRAGSHRKRTQALTSEPQPQNGASAARHQDMSLEY